jgi:hypothetical protein
MLRRRLLSIVGAIGLVGGLISSGVAAHASSAGPDSTYNALVATYLWSGQDICYSNGTAPVTTSPCVIVQATPVPGKSNIAVCVQLTSAAQECDITQTNAANNNYALVIQRINQQGATSSCPVAPPCQNGTQRASILQANGTGSNFGGVIQKVTQSLTERATDNDPQQINQQDLRSLASGVPGLKQTSGGGSNFAAVGQDSQQSQTGALAQSQVARQFAGLTESGQGINQMTAVPGGNAAVLGQFQKQNLQSQVGVTQSQDAFVDGDITQDDGLGTQNFASGNQFQDQQEQGNSTTFQRQFGDPKCCSPQKSGGNFYVTLRTNQLANNIAPGNQQEIIEGNCDSIPDGTCHMSLSATQQGVTTTAPPCTASSCHHAIFLHVET